MRKVMTIALVLIGLTLNAQIEVRENKVDKIWSNALRNQEVVRFITDEDTVYTFYYRNLKYQHITDIKYFSIGSKNDVESLIDYIEDVIENKKKLTLTLSDGNTISLSKSMNSCYIYTGEGYTFFDKNQIEKLRIKITEFENNEKENNNASE